MNNNNNNANRPTCKVVTRPNQRGARIHPRGCKVRNRVVGGTVRKESRATGLLKPVKHRITQRGHEQQLAIRVPGNLGYVNMTFDTGATHTVISEADARRLGILYANGLLMPGLRAGASENIIIAGGGNIMSRSVLNVPLLIIRTGEVVRGRIFIMPQSMPLLGISHIKHIKTLKIKFRPP